MITLFNSYLFEKSEVGTDNQVHTLLQEINTVKNNQTTPFTNDKCWRSTYQYSSISWLLDEIIALSKKAIDFYKTEDTVFANASADKEIKIYYWSNINDIGSRNVMHSHNTGCLSGVYYLQAEGTGSLRLLNPANIIGNCNPLSPFTRDFYFYPKDRDLIIWPSWIPHEVEPNLSSKQRINIAFDIILV